MNRRSLNSYQDCDWCGAMTRGRVADDQVLHCGACLFPLSEGKFRVEASRKVVKENGPANPTHRAMQGVWDEHQSEWIGLAGEWSGPPYLRA